jgi:hypothetical protein
MSSIEDVLGFLSDDKYSFTFVPLGRDRADQQPYFEFGDRKRWPFYNPDRVIMFSGGLDSLAGAVETATGGGKLLLVSHRPVSTLDSRQKSLFRKLREQFPGQLVHVPVWINKAESLGREPTQRTRSFLYTALGALVGHSVRAGTHSWAIDDKSPGNYPLSSRNGGNRYLGSTAKSGEPRPLALFELSKQAALEID